MDARELADTHASIISIGRSILRNRILREPTVVFGKSLALLRAVFSR